MLPVDSIESFLNQQIFGGGGGGSNVKSIQRGTTTVNELEKEVPIEPVDITKSVVILSEKSHPNGGYVAETCTMGSLSDSTTLELNVGLVNANRHPTVEWQVIEFDNIKSLQSGILTTTLATDARAITSVNPLKTLVLFSHMTNYPDALHAWHALCTLKLASATHITFQQYAAIHAKVAWFVIEFN